jgi:hypothetical protein
MGPDGQPQLRNAVGELDVDIILDEGPDTVTLMQDTYDAISQALPAVAPMLSPASSKAVMDVLIETSPLPSDVKKKFRDASEQEQTQPDPKEQEAQAKLALQQQESQSKLALERERATADMLLKKQSADQDRQTEREKAMADMAIEREKAENQIQIEIFKAGQLAQIKQREAASAALQQEAMQPQQQTFEFGNPQDDVTMRTLHYRNGLVLENDAARRKADEMRSSKTDEALAALASVIGQSHHGLIQAMSKPRKAVIHRDPRTGKVIGAMSVTEE